MSLWTQADTPIEKARLVLQPVTLWHSHLAAISARRARVQRRVPSKCWKHRKHYDWCKRRQCDIIVQLWM